MFDSLFHFLLVLVSFSYLGPGDLEGYLFSVSFIHRSFIPPLTIPFLSLPLSEQISHIDPNSPDKFYLLDTARMFPPEAKMKTTLLIPQNNIKPVQEINLSIDSEPGNILYSIYISTTRVNVVLWYHYLVVFEKELKELIGEDITTDITPVGRIYYQTGGKKNVRANLAITQSGKKKQIITGNVVLVRRYLFFISVIFSIVILL